MRVKLTIRFFEREEDTETLNAWMKARGLKNLDSESLPPIGFIAFDEDMPVAACFLRRAEGGVGILDGLATNPECDSPIRHDAIDTLVNMVIEQAKVREMKMLLAWSQDAGTLARAYSRHGFRQLPDTMIAKDLRESPQKH